MNGSGALSVKARTHRRSNSGSGISKMCSILPGTAQKPRSYFLVGARRGRLASAPPQLPSRKPREHGPATAAVRRAAAALSSMLDWPRTAIKAIVSFNALTRPPHGHGRWVVYVLLRYTLPYTHVYILNPYKCSLR